MKLVKRTLREIARLGVIFMAAMLLQAIAAAQIAQPATEIDKRVERLLGKLTLDEKILLLGGINDFFTQSIPRVGIPSLKMSDGPMGVHDYGPTTAYPAGIALASSWDEELAKRVGSSMGKDARARGVHIILGPGMNIYRSPLNGRNFEYFGEDPFLASRMADALLNEGVYVIGFSYPVVPKGRARIRTQMSAAHTPEQIDRAVDAFARVGRSLGVI